MSATAVVTTTLSASAAPHLDATPSPPTLATPKPALKRSASAYTPILHEELLATLDESVLSAVVYANTHHPDESDRHLAQSPPRNASLASPLARALQREPSRQVPWTAPGSAHPAVGSSSGSSKPVIRTPRRSKPTALNLAGTGASPPVLASTAAAAHPSPVSLASQSPSAASWPCSSVEPASPPASTSTSSLPRELTTYPTAPPTTRTLSSIPRASPAPSMSLSSSSSPLTLGVPVAPMLPIDSPGIPPTEEFPDVPVTMCYKYGLGKLLISRIPLAYFLAHQLNTYAPETLLFLLDLLVFDARASDMVAMYLAPGAPLELNVSAPTRAAALDAAAAATDSGDARAALTGVHRAAMPMLDAAWVDARRRGSRAGPHAESVVTRWLAAPQHSYPYSRSDRDVAALAVVDVLDRRYPSPVADDAENTASAAGSATHRGLRDRVHDSWDARRQKRQHAKRKPRHRGGSVGDALAAVHSAPLRPSLGASPGGASLAEIAPWMADEPEAARAVSLDAGVAAGRPMRKRAATADAASAAAHWTSLDDLVDEDDDDEDEDAGGVPVHAVADIAFVVRGKVANYIRRRMYEPGDVLPPRVAALLSEHPPAPASAAANVPMPPPSCVSAPSVTSGSGASVSSLRTSGGGATRGHILDTSDAASLSGVSIRTTATSAVKSLLHGLRRKHRQLGQLWEGSRTTATATTVGAGRGD
ncbi:hypothetical protein AMAG_06936 [Allomyces macrogynus ATCC 38327]|uniref:Uncharacterized protein n=1 Tax=Allomyces macrogynus (strain ATCC 38327) TaxID=578462 RepID=A0A0L0SFN7_ALLM3|nr:hypothetical protein AMAG_06936 [Allomyces macrogynus ATCC 38327]|eukprot:KNE61185.1 hypothetical protein AMAG_06936 [Allomyces macrogynus ATCC 38327]